MQYGSVWQDEAEVVVFLFMGRPYLLLINQLDLCMVHFSASKELDFELMLCTPLRKPSHTGLGFDVTNCQLYECHPCKSFYFIYLFIFIISSVAHRSLGHLFTECFHLSFPFCNKHVPAVRMKL